MRGMCDYAKLYSHSHDAVIRVYDEAGNVIETHAHTGEFKEVVSSVAKRDARDQAVFRLAPAKWPVVQVPPTCTGF